MTTSPVVSITDELIAELEGEIRIARAINNRAPIHPDDLESLLAERADLRRQLAAESVDAERYRYQFSSGEWDYSDEWIDQPKHGVDAAIDAARNIGSGD